MLQVLDAVRLLRLLPADDPHQYPGAPYTDASNAPRNSKGSTGRVGAGGGATTDWPESAGGGVATYASGGSGAESGGQSGRASGATPDVP